MCFGLLVNTTWYDVLTVIPCFMQMWAWDHFSFLRPTPPLVPLTGVPFPRGLFWGNAESAPESEDDNHYVDRLLFELHVLAQVTHFPLSSLFLLAYLLV